MRQRDKYFSVQAYIPEEQKVDGFSYACSQLARFIAGENFDAVADRRMLLLFTEVFSKFEDFSQHANFILDVCASGTLTVPLIWGTQNNDGIIIDGYLSMRRPPVHVQIILLANKRFAVFSAVGDLLAYKKPMKANYDRTEEQAQLLTEQLSRQTEIDQLLQSIDTSGKTTLLSILNAPTDSVFVELPMESVQPVTE